MLRNKLSFLLIIFIVIFMLVLSFSYRNKNIIITNDMLKEETNMESAWDFNQNVKIGWNLGMSLSAYINYPNVIKCYLIIDDVYNELIEKDKTNIINLNDITNKTIKLHFEIPYTLLDGILDWSIERLELDDESIYSSERIESKSINQIIDYEIDNTKYNSFKNIKIKINIHHYYEEDSLEKLNFYETFWCSSITNKKLFETLKDKGINAVRISFDVYNHINKNGIIDKLWLDRLVQIVDYCMELKMYCLVDIVETYGLYVDHLDDESINLFISLWKQVANRFKDYNHLLLFSPFNEIRNIEGQWSTDDIDLLNNMNRLHQIFVDAIRSTGSNNRYRNLILTTYGGSTNKSILNNIKLPNDVSYNHLLIESHYYEPVRFTFNEINLGNNNFIDEWGSPKDYDRLYETFEMLNNFIQKNKIPYIIGEFGAVTRTNIKERIKYLSYYLSLSKSNKVNLFIFDDSYEFKIIDRDTYTFNEEEIVDLLTK